ncbi:MAG: SRPBCC domain-containing protein [Nitrospiraceae bacterium]|nr:SRPBCC domain-containing protein [Nitrospiraceae bacterium]
MANIIHQTVSFTASPAALFNIYLDSKKHGAAIDDRVSIGRKAGARFTAFSGMLRGRNLVIVPNQMIVQSWRAKPWRKSDPDSILILLFHKVGRGGQIELIHVGMPDYDYLPIKRGWTKYYWIPWKKYLTARRSR